MMSFLAPKCLNFNYSKSALSKSVDVWLGGASKTCGDSIYLENFGIYEDIYDVYLNALSDCKFVIAIDDIDEMHACLAEALDNHGMSVHEFHMMTARMIVFKQYEYNNYETLGEVLNSWSSVYKFPESGDLMEILEGMELKKLMELVTKG